METVSALLALCAGNSPVSGEFPSQRPVTRSVDVSLICALINSWVNNRKAVDLRHNRANYDVSVVMIHWPLVNWNLKWHRRYRLHIRCLSTIILKCIKAETSLHSYWKISCVPSVLCTPQQSILCSMGICSLLYCPALVSALPSQHQVILEHLYNGIRLRGPLNRSTSCFF